MSEQVTEPSTPTTGAVDAAEAPQITLNVPSEGAEADEAQEQTAPPDPAKAEPAATEPKADAAEKSEASEPYEVTTPKGSDFDSGVIASYGKTAQELGLTKEQAQGVFDKVAPLIRASEQGRHEKRVAEWGDTARKDGEFGGSNLAPNLQTANKALTTFGNPELSELLKATGLAEHPEVIRFMFRVGKAISTDQRVDGRPKGAAKERHPDPAMRLFD